jgi:hypothetical protein
MNRQTALELDVGVSGRTALDGTRESVGQDLKLGLLYSHLINLAIDPSNRKARRGWDGRSDNFEVELGGPMPPVIESHPVVKGEILGLAPGVDRTKKRIIRNGSG